MVKKDIIDELKKLLYDENAMFKLLVDNINSIKNQEQFEAVKKEAIEELNKIISKYDA